MALSSVIISVLLGCGGSSVAPPVDEPMVSSREGIDKLWNQNVVEYLQSDLWISDYNYDAAHVLMVPMHWAFNGDNTREFQSVFDDYFERYTREGGVSEEQNRLRKLQYLYLHSQYLKLAHFDPAGTGFKAQLYNELLDTVEQLWSQEEVATYGGRVFKNGMRERFRFKMDAGAVVPEYAKAIFDEEFFFLAIAADLISIGGQTRPDFLYEIQQTYYELFLQEGIEIGSGWLFQPGLWSNHPDYAYAGHLELANELQPIIIEDIATDSSHFHRMPLWLLSLRDSYDSDRSEWIFFENLVQRVNWQFESIIFVPPDPDFPAPRINNYTDGWNGIYRYGYDTVGDSLGYGPYQLSAVVLPLGWYAFLESDLLYASYANLQFPLNDTVITTYVGPNTSRVRHPLVVWPDYFENGFAELHVNLALQLNSWNNK